MRDCVKRIVETSNGAFNKEDAKKLLNDVDRLARKRAKQGYDLDDSIKEVLTEKVENAQKNYEKQKLNTLKNIAIKSGYVDKVSQMVDSGISIEKAFEADLVGIQSPVKGARDSVDNVMQTVQNNYLNKFVYELEKNDLLGVFNSKVLNKEIANELWDLSDGGKGGVTKSKEAQKIAKIIHGVQENLKGRLNKAGADIGDVEGFIMSHSHDQLKLSKVSQEEWVNTIKPLLDEKRSFDGDSLDEALPNAYEALVTGVRLDDPTIKDSKLFQFTGPANIAKRLSGRRVMHFKNAESFLAYNEKFGNKDLNDTVIDSIGYAAKNIALMERYGTNPEAMIDATLKEIQKKYRDKTAKSGKRTDENVIKNRAAEILGKTHFTTSPKFATISSNIRSFNTLTSLGGVVLSSISDIPTKAFTYQYNGKNFLSSYVQSFADIANGFKGKKERLEFASLLGSGVEGIIGDIGARFSANDTGGAVMTKLMRKFFKLNGLSWWTDANKLGAAKVFSHDLALKKNLSFAELDTNTKRIFGNYNIGEKEWNSIRQGASKMEDGREYIFSESIKDQKAAQKLDVYYLDNVNSAVITAGAKERSIATQGTQRGTPLGEALRFVMQFKQFPITYITRALGRTIHAKGKADIPMLAQMMLMSGVFGYLAMSAKDVFKGKEPRDISKKETIFAALAQGGGLGIYGDFLFQDMSRFGGGFAETMSGPTAGKIGDLFRVLGKVKKGEDPSAELVKLGIQNTPFANVFYVKPALDYLIVNQIQEQLNPGYLRRMERRMKQDYGQEFWLRPSSATK
jgi:hypothetical protein